MAVDIGISPYDWEDNWHGLTAGFPLAHTIGTGRCQGGPKPKYPQYQMNSTPSGRILVVMRGSSLVRHAPALCAACCAVACLSWTGCRPGDSAASSGALTSAKTESGHPAVGLLLIDASGGTAKGICTTSLVGPHTALTAAHCIKSGVTNLLKFGGKTYPIAKTIRHASYAGNYHHDIALVISKSAIPIAPALVSSSPPKAGMAVTLVGFGRTSDNDGASSGTKRITTNTVNRVGNDYFVISGNGNACTGDSGGPIFAKLGGREVIVGTNSQRDVPCGGKSYNVTISAHLSWLKQKAGSDLYLKTTSRDGSTGASDAGVPTDSGSSGGGKDGSFVSTAGFGASCSNDNDCNSRMCRAPPGGGSRYCTNRCSTDTASCPEASSCLADQPQPYCGPLAKTATGGCSYGSASYPAPGDENRDSGPDLWPGLALAAIALAAARRRRHRARVGHG